MNNANRNTTANPSSKAWPTRQGPMGAAARWRMMRRGEKPRDFKGTLTKLIQYLGRYRLLILFV